MRFFAIIERNLITLNKNTSGVHRYVHTCLWNINMTCLNMGLRKNKHDMHFVLHTIIIFELVWSYKCVGANLNSTLPRAKISHLLGRLLNKERIIFRLFQGGYTFWWTDMALAIPQLSIGGTSLFMPVFRSATFVQREFSYTPVFWNFGNFGVISNHWIVQPHLLPKQYVYIYI